jgi:hypothetical protein
MLPEWAASFGEARWYLSPGTVPLFNQLDKYVTLRPSMRPAHRTPSVRDGREANVRSQGRSARADPARGYTKSRFDPSPSLAACGVAATYFVGAAAFLAGAFLTGAASSMIRASAASRLTASMPLRQAVFDSYVSLAATTRPLLASKTSVSCLLGRA